jgi:Flp pilus assembly protein protease CpaA
MNLQLIQLIPVVYLLLVSIPVSATDIREYRIPNKYILPAFPLWLVSATTYSAIFGDWWNSLLLPLLLALALGIPLLILNNVGMVGMGDVKLFVIMGLSLSWKSLWVWLLFPSVLIISTILLLAYVFFLGRPLHTRSPLAPVTFMVYAITTAILFLN